jgi:hypothetical protein
VEEVNKMRKTSIGIFASVTAILFLLSMSISVTAATHTEVLMVLGSRVKGSSPFAEVSFTPQNVWNYDDWTWTLDINNGDDVVIRTNCTWENTQFIYPPSDTGVHYFDVIADYYDPVPPRLDSDDEDYQINTSYNESGWTILEVSITNVQEGAQIYLTWFVETTNTVQTPDVIVGDQETGTIYLT